MFKYIIRYVVEERREVVIVADDAETALRQFNRNAEFDGTVPERSYVGRQELISRELRKSLTYVHGTEA